MSVAQPLYDLLIDACRYRKDAGNHQNRLLLTVEIIEVYLEGNIDSALQVFEDSAERCTQQMADDEESIRVQADFYHDVAILAARVVGPRFRDAVANRVTALLTWKTVSPELRTELDQLLQALKENEGETAFAERFEQKLSVAGMTFRIAEGFRPVIPPRGAWSPLFALESIEAPLRVHYFIRL